MWKQEEKQEFFNLLKEHYLSEAARRFSKSSGRSVHTIIIWFYYNKKKGRIPEDVLNALHKNKEPWSPSEEKELFKLVGRHPGNFNDAFRIHADNTGRNTKAVALHFIRCRKKEGAQVCMLTLGKGRQCPNRKNIHSKTGGRMKPFKVSKWKRILQIIFE